MPTSSSVTFTITAQDHASAVLATVNANLHRTASQAATTGAAMGGPAREGAKKFQTALTTLALHGIGVHGTLGKLINSASLLAVGSATMLPIVAGVAAVAAAIHFLGKEAREAKEKLTEFIAEAIRAGRVRSGQVLYEDYGQANRAVIRFQEQLRRGTTQGMRVTGKGGVAVKVPLTSEQREDIRKQLDDALEARLEHSNRIMDRGGVSGIDPSLAKAAKEAQRLKDLIAERLFSVYSDVGMAGGGTPLKLRGGAMQPGAEAAAAPVSPMFTAAQESVMQVIDAFDNEWGPALANAVQNAFTRAFSGEGIVGLFRGFAAAILAALGNLFSQLGSAMVAASALIAKIRAALATLNPAATLAAGIGLIALGSLLGAVSAKMSGGTGGGGGGFSGPSGYSGAGYAQTQKDMASQRTAVTVNIKGGPMLNLSDHEQREGFVSMLREVTGGTREFAVNVGRS